MKHRSVSIPTMITSKEFVKIIDEIAQKEGLTLLSAVSHFCERNNVEVETAASLIKSSSKFKKRMTEEARTLNLLKK